MKHLEELIFLIDAASAIAGNDNRLAASLGVSRGNVSDWRAGRRACPPEHQVLMAALAGFDPLQTATRALVHKHEGTDLGDRLMRALGKASRATGAVLGFVGASALAIYSLAPTPSHAAEAQATRDNVYKRNKRYVKHRLALG